jgi:hypothetical protein
MNGSSGSRHIIGIQTLLIKSTTLAWSSTRVSYSPAHEVGALQQHHLEWRDPCGEDQEGVVGECFHRIAFLNTAHSLDVLETMK